MALLKLDRIAKTRSRPHFSLQIKVSNKLFTITLLLSLNAINADYSNRSRYRVLLKFYKGEDYEFLFVLIARVTP